MVGRLQTGTKNDLIHKIFFGSHVKNGSQGIRTCQKGTAAIRFWRAKDVKKCSRELLNSTHLKKQQETAARQGD